MSLNAITTEKSRRLRADHLFMNFLNQHSLPDTIAPLVEQQLKKMIDHYHESLSINDQSLESRLKEFEKKKKELTIRHGLGEIDRETYDLTLSHITDQMQAIYKELNILPQKISNLEKLFANAVEKLKKLSVMWGFGSLDSRGRIQKILFPEGSLYDVKKHDYRTQKINGFLLVTIL